MDVICKEGLLYLQCFKFGKKTWRKVWMVLFKPSSTGVGRLEFCAASDSTTLTGRQKSTKWKVVRLSDCVSVTPAAREACPAGCTAFKLNAKQCHYIFASMSSQDWTSALCLLAFQRDPGGSDKGDFEGGTGLTMEDNDLYSSWKRDRTPPPNQYEVMVQSTEASKWCKLAGKYLVSTTTDELVLSDIGTGGVIFCWPYKLLRKFGQVEGGFSIEAGRRCDSGEGVFIFQTQHGPQIFQAIADQCLLDKEASDRSQSFPDIRDTNNRSADEHYIMCAPSSGDCMKHLGLVKPYLSSSKEEVGEVGEEGEDEEECCLSLEAMNWGDDTEDSIYYNLRRATPPPIRFTDPPNLDFIHPGYNTHAVDEAKETEDAVSCSAQAVPTEAPGSFKHRLAEIISKDLAKFQPPLPPRAGSPTPLQ
ncbi:docking protein 3-like [Nematolebias whitei]|uniref:docking protein 3-like n=1 Tax=Nematolebias whitei TaxID=451745 RepID=UPI0018974E15|nr:docking protein 3-like [Nematolebias whitei]